MGSMGCGPKCAQIILFIFNIIFWLSGVTLLAIGIWILVDDDYERYLDVLKEIDDSEFIKIAAYILIGAGAFVFLVGFMGCCGAWKLNKCMLGIYAFLLILVLCIELAAGIYAIIKRDDILKKVKDEWEDVIKDKYEYREESAETNAFTLGMDFLQIRFDCCGVNTGQEKEAYQNSNFTRQSEGLAVPLSCCQLKPDEDLDSVDKVNKFLKLSVDKQKEKFVDWDTCMRTGETATNDQGCVDSLEDFVENKSVILIGLGIGIACIELFGILFAICLCRSIED